MSLMVRATPSTSVNCVLNKVATPMTRNSVRPAGPMLSARTIASSQINVPLPGTIPLGCKTTRAPKINRNIVNVLSSQK